MSQVPDQLFALAEEWSGTFKTLADPTRLKLLLALHYRGPGVSSVSELAEDTDLSVANTSRALGQMAEAGVISANREGRSVLYRLSDDRIHTLLHHLGGVHEHDR